MNSFAGPWQCHSIVGFASGMMMIFETLRVLLPPTVARGKN